MAHSHSHAGQHHGHGLGHHHHAPADFGRAFAIGIVLNLGFVAVEAFYGWMSNSMALLADAGHNLADVLGLATAWAGAVLAKRPASRRFSYGFRGASILAALANAVLLLIAVCLIVYHAAWRLIVPDLVEGETVIVVAAIGIVVNLGTALMFMRGRKSDINVRGAWLHMIADALVSAGVVVAGIGIAATGWLWIDPVTSLIVAGMIFLATADLFRESLTMAMAGVPRSIDPEKVEEHLLALPGVTRVHDLHIWSMSTTEYALTAHLVMPEGFPGDACLQECAPGLAPPFASTQATVQIEVGTGQCRGADAH